jgi:hypothetical protein
VEEGGKRRGQQGRRNVVSSAGATASKHSTFVLLWRVACPWRSRVGVVERPTWVVGWVWVGSLARKRLT